MAENKNAMIAISGAENEDKLRLTTVYRYCRF